jgi:broad specificity polyphosphatase/5'/3'-nucleotidase SurE
LNIPQLSKGSPKGLLVVPQSTHGFEEQYQTRPDKYGRLIYQLTGGIHRDPEGSQWTDATALEAGYVTLTCLRQELTDLTGNEMLKQKELKFKY